MSSFTDQEKAEAAEREVKQRIRVYTRLIANGRMSKEFADRQVDIMREIAADYRASASAQPSDRQLFP